jgi:cysteinyl-tRNA synthetase
MAMSLLGESLDIHCGGVDNIFPHHENEIAQSEACTNKTFAKCWAHSEHLIVDNKKMSKSLGNFFTLRDLLDKGFKGKEVRYLLLQTHYKTQLNFTLKGLDAAKASLERVQEFIYRLQQIKSEDENSNIKELLERSENDFKAALADDLNISVALAALFNLLRDVNTLCDQNKIGVKSAKTVLATLEQFNIILEVLDFTPQDVTVSTELQDAFERRQQARAAKNWALADELRAFIEDKGYSIVDTPEGPRLKEASKK